MIRKINIHDSSFTRLAEQELEKLRLPQRMQSYFDSNWKAVAFSPLGTGCTLLRSSNAWTLLLGPQARSRFTERSFSNLSFDGTRIVAKTDVELRELAKFIRENLLQAYQSMHHPMAG